MKQIALILVLGLVVGQSLAVDARLRGTNKRRAAEQWTCDTPGSNPQQLPGIESMGTGYNIVTGSMTSGALFGTRAYTQHALFQPGANAPCYRIPDMFVKTSDGVGQGVLGVNFFNQIADSDTSDVYGSSVHEFQTELANSNDLKSSFDAQGFGAKLSAAYSNSDEINNVVSQMTNSTTRTLMMTENVQAYTATQQSFRFVKDVTNWWRQLTDAPFSANDGDDASSITWEQYFANFGTHVVTEAKIGGSIEITISWDSKDSAFNRMDAEKQKQCIKASASYMFGDDNVGGSVDDCWGHESSENHAAKILSENTQTNIVCRGGADACPNNARSASALTAWRKAVLARPTYGVPARTMWTGQVIRDVAFAAGAEGHTELGFDSAADLRAFLKALKKNTYTYLSRNGLCALHPGACGYADRAVEALVAPAATADDATVDVHAFLTKGYPALVNAAVTRDGVARSQQAVLAALKTAAAGGTYLTHNSKQCENSAGAFKKNTPADGFCNGQADCISKAKEHCDNIPLCIGFMYAPAWSSTNVQWCKGHTLTGSNDWTAYTSTGVSSGAIATSTAAFGALAKAMLTASATAVNALAASDVAGGIFENVTALVAKIGTMEEGDGTAAPSPERVLAADLAAILDNAADELEGIKKELEGARRPLRANVVATDEMKKHASTSLNMRVTDQKTVVTNAQNACNRNVKTARERAYPSCAALVFIPPAAAACYAAAIPIVENKHADCNHGVAAMRAELLVRQDALASFNKEAQKFVAQAGNIASAAHAFETQLSSPDRATGRVAGVVPALRQLASDLSNEDSPLAWWKSDILAKLKGVAATYSESFVNEASWLLKCCDGDDCEVAASTRARRMAITGPACHAAGGTLV